MVLLNEGTDFKLVMDSNELAACNGNAQAFVQKVQEKGAFANPASPL